MIGTTELHIIQTNAIPCLECGGDVNLCVWPHDSVGSYTCADPNCGYESTCDHDRHAIEEMEDGDETICADCGVLIDRDYSSWDYND